MAQGEVKITFTIDGISQSVSSVEELQDALKGVQTQADKTADAIGDTAKEADKLADAGKEAGEAGEGALTLIDEATGGLGTRFVAIGKGLKALGTSAKTAFKTAVTGANTFKKALISTGIGALVVALGLIVAYWEDIKGLVSGVSREQKDVLKATEDTVAAAQEQLDATSLQEETLKAQGMTEEEIRDLKIQQTNEVIAATEAQLAQQKEVKKAQVAAAERNQKIAAGIIAFLTAPITLLLGAIDALTYGLEKIGVIEKATSLAKDFTMGTASLIFDPEEVAAEGDETIKETEQQLMKLKNQRDGYENRKKADAQKRRDEEKAEAAKQAEEDAKAAEEAAAKAEAARLEAEKKAAEERQKLLDNRKIIDEALQQANLESIEDTFERAQAELAIQREADMEKLRQAGATAEELAKIDEMYAKRSDAIAEESAKFQSDMKAAQIENDLGLASSALGTVAQLAGEGSAVAKAAAIAQTTIDTYMAAQKAYTSQLIPGDPTSVVRAAIAAGIAVAAGVANVAKIVATPIPEGGGGTGGAPSISAPQTPQFNPQAALAATVGDNTAAPGDVTSQQTGSQSTIVRAYVVDSEVTSQQEATRKIENLASL